MADRSQVYIEGFLDGQVTAYCEQVRLGSRLAGAIGCDQDHAERLSVLVTQEGCRSKIVLGQFGRICLWIYRHEFVEGIIDHLHSVPEQQPPSDFSLWATGKLFGYADCEIASCIAGKLNAGSR